MKKVSLLLLLLLSVSFTGYGQEVIADDVEEEEEMGYPDSGWYLAGTLGGFFANSGTADFYRGDGQYGINWIFSHQVYQDQIKRVLGLDQQDFYLGELPDTTTMRYQPGFILGGNGGFRFNENSAIFFDVNITTLKIQDIFTIYVDDPINFEPIIHQAGITGEEKRLQINLGYRQLFGDSETSRWFMEIAGSFNDTEVRSNEIHIENLTYSVVRPVVPNSPTQIQFITGGSSFGGVLGGGLNYRMNKDFAFDLGAHLRFEKIILDRNEVAQLQSQWMLFCRFIFK